MIELHISISAEDERASGKKSEEDDSEEGLE
jgi:hypothetical protein